MDKPIAATVPALRPWYRPHLSTWLILSFGLVVAVLIVLPGGMGRPPERKSWLNEWRDVAVVHGWPLPYL